MYDEDSIGWTEAPGNGRSTDSPKRFRWTFGTLQSFWKHRDTLGRPRYGTLGFVALPNIFLFQLLLPLVSPVIDLLFLGSIALWGLGQLHLAHLPQLWTTADVERSVIFFIGFMLIDFLTCVIAFALEHREDWSLLWPLLLQQASTTARWMYMADCFVPRGEAAPRARRRRGLASGVEPEIPKQVAHA